MPKLRLHISSFSLDLLYPYWVIPQITTPNIMYVVRNSYTTVAKTHSLFEGGVVSGIGQDLCISPVYNCSNSGILTVWKNSFCAAVQWLIYKTQGQTDSSRTINNWVFLTCRCTNKDVQDL